MELLKKFMREKEPWELAFPNLINGTPENVAELKALYERYAKEIGAPIIDVKLSTSTHILQPNFEYALVVAIEVQTQREKLQGYTGDSALLAGWKEVLEVSQRGGNVELRK